MSSPPGSSLRLVAVHGAEWLRAVDEHAAPVEAERVAHGCEDAVEVVRLRHVAGIARSSATSGAEFASSGP